MNAHALRAPRTLVGTDDATRDHSRPAARTLEQCAGAQRSSTARIEPIGAAHSMSLADKAVLAASSLAGLFVLALLAYERFAP